MINRISDHQLIDPINVDRNFIICIFLRILLGFLVLYADKKIVIPFLVILILVVSINSYYKAPNYKLYLNNILTNSLSLILVFLEKKDIASALIFVNTLASIQTKHIASLIVV